MRSTALIVSGLVFFSLAAAPMAHAAEAKPVAPKEQAAESAKSGEPRKISPEALYAAMLVNAEKGDPGAMLTLGALYEQGLGAPKNFTSALQWFEKAAFAGSAEGYFRLGGCYEIGMGATADMAKAVAAFEKAAGMGSSQALHKMASLNFLGRGMPKNPVKGLEYLTKAASAGNSVAANELAFVHLKGIAGQKEDPVKAREWFTKSAEAGNLEGIKNLAVMFKDGLGGKPDAAGALRWYLIAQKGGLNAPDLETVIDGLKKSLKSAQVKKAGDEAEKWMENYKKRAQNDTV